MNMARIRDGIVINLEVHGDDGGDFREVDGDLLVCYSNDKPAFLGYSYNYETHEFEQPEADFIDHPLNEISLLVEAALDGK